VNAVRLSTLATVAPPGIPVPEIVIPGIRAAVLATVTVASPEVVAAAVRLPEGKLVAVPAIFPVNTIGIAVGVTVVGNPIMPLPEVVEHPLMACVPAQPSAPRFKVTCVPLSTEAICVPDGSPYPYKAIPAANPDVLSTINVREP
jgi:hypothetical protein